MAAPRGGGRPRARDPGAVPVAAADVAEDPGRHLRVSAEARLRADARALPDDLGHGLPALLRQQRGRGRALHGAGHAAGRSRRLCAVARTVPGRRLADPVDPGLPHGAADRVHDSVLPRLPASGAARHAHGAGDRLPDVQPLARRLADAVVLRRRAALARGGRVDRRGQPAAGIRPHRAAAVGAGPRRHRDPVLPLCVERFLLRADPHAHGGDDGPRRRRQFHELRGLGVGQDRRRRHAGHAAGARLLVRRPEVPRAGAHRGRPARLTRIIGGHEASLAPSPPRPGRRPARARVLSRHGRGVLAAATRGVRAAVPGAGSRDDHRARPRARRPHPDAPGPEPFAVPGIGRHARLLRANPARAGAAVGVERGGAHGSGRYPGVQSPQALRLAAAEVGAGPRVPHARRDDRPAVSPLVKGAVSGVPTTAVATPVRARDGTVQLLGVAIDSPIWLRFLSSIPVIPGATMTLLDQNGIVIARTLNPEKWVGLRASPALYEKSRETPEAAYRNIGLEGQWFYTAHSRSKVSGWTVATGVPVEDVERELRGSTIAMTGGAALTVALAVALALVFGRRIAQPVSALAGAAMVLERGERPPPTSTTTIAEVANVAHAFDSAAERLRAREAALRHSETESRRLAAERANLLDNERAARKEAETANRMKDEFLATLSHELRTPLTAVFGWARSLRLGQADAAAMARGLESIERNATAQVRLIEDLLDSSRIVTGKMRLDVRAVDLPVVVENAVDAIRPAANAKQIRLQTVLDPLAGPVMGDPDRLQQVVWNLVSNAVKFTPREGRVQIRLARVESHVEIVVSDTGQGMAPEVVPHVFERFRQADSSMTRTHGGLGLGLALVKHLVEVHGGGVAAHSAGKGRGATSLPPRRPAPCRTCRSRACACYSSTTSATPSSCSRKFLPGLAP